MTARPPLAAARTLILLLAAAATATPDSGLSPPQPIFVPCPGQEHTSDQAIVCLHFSPDPHRAEGAPEAVPPFSGTLRLVPDLFHAADVAIFANHLPLAPHHFNCTRDVRWWQGRLTDHPSARVRLTRACAAAHHCGLACPHTEATWEGYIHLNDGHSPAYRLTVDPTQGLRLGPASAEDLAALHQAAGSSCAGAPAGHILTLEADSEDEELPFLAPGRQRRAGRLSPQHTQCSLSLDADGAFASVWGGVGSLEERTVAVAAKMLDLVFQVDAIYQLPTNLEGQLALRVQSVHVHHNLNLLTRTNSLSSGVSTEGTFDGLDFLTQYQLWLGQGQQARGPDAPSFADACLNHGFTHTNLRGVLGVAIQASQESGVIGGLCAQIPIGGRALNVGISSTRTSAGRASTWQSVLSIAHEIAHNLGAAHTCEFVQLPGTPVCALAEGRDPCVPNAAQGGPFIMFPAVSLDDAHRNARSFSSCSLDSMAAVLAAKGECLQEPHACAQGSGACCLGSHLLPRGAPCDADANRENPCMAQPVCDGSSSTCPAPEPREDGTACSFPGLALGVCRQGQCEHPHQGACSEVGLQPCTLPEFPCMSACLSDFGGVDASTSTATCLPLGTDCAAEEGAAPLAQLGALGLAPGCPLSLENTPCLQPPGAVGVCAGSTCTTCDAQCQEELSRDVVALECEIAESTNGICSEPCGTGVETITHACQCFLDGSPIATEPGACNPVGGVPAASLLQCAEGGCTSRRAERVQVTLQLGPEDPPFALDSQALLVALETLLGIPLRASVTTSSDAQRVELIFSSCRSTLSEGCLSAADLIARIEQPRVAQALENMTGHSVVASAVTDPKQLDALTIAAIALACVAGLLGVWLLIQAWRQRKREAARRKAMEAELIAVTARVEAAFHPINYFGPAPEQNVAGTLAKAARPLRSTDV